ncbi:MAG: CBS domain-containing protein, partial [Actinomycetota bacterium]|nr:CBS domain-containing protein [Actinomycetota bacterium]
MIYLSRMLGKPVVDAAGAEIGTVQDVAIATGEIFPRVTSLAFLGPDKTPFMLSWRKFVETFDDERIALNVARADMRFSYLQPDEVLLARDLLNKQIVDTQGMKVVRVNDLKLSESRNQLRLLGAEVGVRGILRALSPALERIADGALHLIGKELPENLIAWNYMDLLDRDLSHVRLSVTHKRLHELHPADVADILEKLSAAQRAKVFEHLDNTQAADTISELEDDLQADVIDDLTERRASDLLAEMDPDDAADIIGDLPYDKAERLLRLMGVDGATAIRSLLGYREKTAGGIMTPEVTTVTEDMTVEGVIEHLRGEAAEHESIYYIYVVEGDSHLVGVISLRDLIMSAPATPVAEIAERDLFTVAPDDDQEDVAETMSKYDLLALPVVDETGKLLGIVTVDDALEVLEEESAEDLALATGSGGRGAAVSVGGWILRRSAWVIIWAVALFGVVITTSRLDESVSQQFGPSWLVISLSFLGTAVLFLPVLLRTGEDSSSRAIAELISGTDEDERPTIGRRLLAEGALGLGAGIAAGLLGF